MNLLDLKTQVDNAIEYAKECEADPADVTVSIQVETLCDSLWSSDVTLYYDNDGQASGCVLVGKMDAREASK